MPKSSSKARDVCHLQAIITVVHALGLWEVQRAIVRAASVELARIMLSRIRGRLSLPRCLQVCMPFAEDCPCPMEGSDVFLSVTRSLMQAV